MHDRIADCVLSAVRFWAIYIASGSVRLWDLILQLLCTVLSHMMRGRPRALLQYPPIANG